MDHDGLKDGKETPLDLTLSTDDTEPEWSPEKLIGFLDQTGGVIQELLRQAGNGFVTNQEDEEEKPIKAEESPVSSGSSSIWPSFIGQYPSILDSASLSVLEKALDVSFIDFSECFAIQFLMLHVLNSVVSWKEQKTFLAYLSGCKFY